MIHRRIPYVYVTCGYCIFSYEKYLLVYDLRVRSYLYVYQNLLLYIYVCIRRMYPLLSDRLTFIFGRRLLFPDRLVDRFVRFTPSGSAVFWTYSVTHAWSLVLSLSPPRYRCSPSYLSRTGFSVHTFLVDAHLHMYSESIYIIYIYRKH